MTPTASRTRSKSTPADPSDSDGSRDRLGRQLGSCRRWGNSADLSLRAKQLLRPTSDGGPPLSRPVVVVRLPNEKLRSIRDQAVAASARRDTETCTELAELEVRRAFSKRDGDMRAIMGDW